MNITSALIVDDSKMDRITLKKHLESLDIKVDMVENGEESLEFLKSHRPDVIFMDCLMPEIDGFETTRLISSNPDTASIPVIMCSDKESDEDKHKAMDAGAFSYMLKTSSSGPLKDILADLDKFDAQMSRITAPEENTSATDTNSAADSINSEDEEILLSTTPEQAIDKDLIVQQTLNAVENVLHSQLNPIMSDFNQLSNNFSALSEQLENKIIFSVKSSIKESHQYTDAKTAEISAQLDSLRQDLEDFRTRMERIDFDQLILETINTHLDSLLDERQTEMAHAVINNESVQAQLNEQIQSAVKPANEQLTAIEQKLEQKLQEPAAEDEKEGEAAPKTGLYIAVTALLVSLGAAALSALPFLTK